MRNWPKWLVGLGVITALFAPLASSAGSIQYVYVSGSFSYTAGVLSGAEGVKVRDSIGNPIGAYPDAHNYQLSVNTAMGLVSGSLQDLTTSTTLFNFSNGTISAFLAPGSTAVFAVTKIKYSSVDAPLVAQGILNNSIGSFTGSTTAWKGSSGKFNGQFSAVTPELGSSVAMASMLLGAGFLGFFRRRKA